jgi:hypothetical protein
MKNVVFWKVKPCSSCKNQRFGGTYRLHHHGGVSSKKYDTIFLRSERRLLVTANVAPSSPILVTLMKTVRSSETSNDFQQTASVV